MKLLLVAVLNVTAIALALHATLPQAERGIGKLALSTGHYDLAINLYADSLRRELAKCVRA